jgi:GT2 family glycosyltransferase
MNFGLVIVNFNNSKYTRQAVTSLLNDSGELLYPVIVVDNASTGNSVIELKEIEKQFPMAHMIFSSKNVGYFKGLNLGIELGRSQFPSIDYWIVGNNDLLFPREFPGMLESSRALLDQYPVISPNITTLEGEPQNPHVINNISKIRGVIYDLYHLSYPMARVIMWLARLTHRFTDRSDETQFEVAQEIYQGYGACYILGPRFFEYFSELWAPSFLMYEEFFLAKQLGDIGYKTYYEPSIQVIHQCKGATAEMPGKFKWECSRDSHNIYTKYVKSW